MTKTIEKHTLSMIVFLLALLTIAGISLLILPHTAHSQTSTSTTVPLYGYAWSDNIGWISLNCATGGPGGANICARSNYELSIDVSGVLSGYAWSDNIGWISANSTDLSGCPSAPCTATVSGNAFSGWLNALSADNNGWDGWISLKGANYGVTTSGGTFSGFAWGSNVVGWTDFQYATSPYGTCTAATVYSCSGETIVQTVTATSCNVTTTDITTCVSPAFCATGSAICLYPAPTVISALAVRPNLVQRNSTVKVTWNIGTVQSCAVSGSNNDGTSASTDANSPGLWNTLTGNMTSSPITQQTIYTLSCVQDDPSLPPFVESASVNVAPTFHEQ